MNYSFTNPLPLYLVFVHKLKHQTVIPVLKAPTVGGPLSGNPVF